MVFFGDSNVFSGYPGLMVASPRQRRRPGPPRGAAGANLLVANDPTAEFAACHLLRTGCLGRVQDMAGLAGRLDPPSVREPRLRWVAMGAPGPPSRCVTPVRGTHGGAPVPHISGEQTSSRSHFGIGRVPVPRSARTQPRTEACHGDIGEYGTPHGRRLRPAILASRRR